MPNLSQHDQTTEFLLYTAPNGYIKVDVLLNNETIWLTQERMAEMFGVQRPAITKHSKNIFDSGEWQGEVVSSILEHTSEHGAITGKTQTHAEYDKFNKQQRIESDFDREIKKLLNDKDRDL